MIGINTKLKLTLEVSDNDGHRKYVSEYCGDPEVAQHENNLISQVLCEFLTYNNIDFAERIITALSNEIKISYINGEYDRMGHNPNDRKKCCIYKHKAKKTKNSHK